jgi:hypothetical protein
MTTTKLIMMTIMIVLTLFLRYMYFSCIHQFKSTGTQIKHGGLEG